MKNKIILASASPRRKELMRKIVKDFRVVESGVDESGIKADSPYVFVRKAAIAKAQAVAAKHKDSIVIGADTIVLLGKKILGKPKNKKDAITMLKSLSGRTHQVATGIAVVFPGANTVSQVVITRIKTQKISDKDIIAYVNTGAPLDKAGAYGIQEIEALFIDKIEGDYDNVVGLPVNALKNILNNVV